MIENGVDKKLFDLVELNDEHSVAIVQMLLQSLTNEDLDVKNITSFAAISSP